MRPWENCGELLSLFSIQRSKWAELFIDLVESGAVVLRFTGYDLGDLERQMMRELHLSPLVFWSNIKRAVRPLLDAGPATLQALGLPVGSGLMTGHDLALSIATVLAGELGEEDADLGRQFEEVLARGKR